tara:strand:- start:733 stop:1632 length:900 start_codon:yes stop_codon:yes gene_type:complete
MNSHTPPEMRPVKLGVIGGSGLYNISGLEGSHWREVYSPFGKPSDKFLCGQLKNLDVVFLPRHGRDHVYLPSEINFRANIDALKRLNVTDIISISAVGSLQENFIPGDFVIIDQLIDQTFQRERSFFSKGLVAHVSMAEPVCNRLGDKLFDAAKTIANLNLKRGGTYITIEGPQFSSKAESALYKNWGGSVIGMTNMPEAKLAREAEICYATVAMVTDFDCWHPDHENVSVERVMKAVKDNAENAKKLVQFFCNSLKNKRNFCTHKCDTSLQNAMMTKKGKEDPAVLKNLSAIIKRVDY